MDDGTYAIPSPSAGKIKKTDQWRKGLGLFHPSSSGKIKRTDQWRKVLGQFQPLQQVKGLTSGRWDVAIPSLSR